MLCHCILPVVINYSSLCRSEKMGIQKSLTEKSLVSSLAFSLTVIPISLVLYQSNTVRYVFVTLITVATIILIISKKDQIIATVRKFRKANKYKEGESQ